MTDAAPDLTRLRIDRSRSDGPARRSRAPFWVLLVLVLLYVAWREGWLPGADDRPAVTVARVVRTGDAPARSGIAANGYVVARTRAALSTDIQGRIVELPVEEGDLVEAGQLVARLDTRQLAASLAQARAQLEGARATASLAVMELERHEALLASGDVTEARRDQALATRNEAVAAVDRLEAQVEEIEVMIDKSSVYAPFRGVVIAKNAEVGEVVAALGASAGPSAAVVTIVDFDSLEVQVELSQTSLSAAQVGAPVEIFLDAWPLEAYPGRVRQIWPTADRQKATVEVRCDFLRRDERLLPELGVRVVFVEDHGDPPGREGEAPEAQVLVPRRALRGPPGARTVLVYVEGAVQQRPVVTGEEASGGMVSVTEGLVGGERVVVGGPEGLEDGAAVRVDDEGAGS